MLPMPLKYLTSLLSGDNNLLNKTHNNNLTDDDTTNITSTQSRNRIPLFLFTPTHELIHNTIKLATITRALGMDLHPNPSLSHILFSWPPSLQNAVVPLPFPSFTTSSLSHLRLFVNLSKGYFKLVFLTRNNGDPLEKIESLSNYNWNCTEFSLFFGRTGEKIVCMDGLSKALIGMGWTLFRSSCEGSEKSVYLYRRSDVSKICNVEAGESSRVRELRLPSLDFRNVPLRILQYVLLMTDDVFYLA